MKKFVVKKSDPTRYKGEIIEFWKNYLPGTPAERFDWMNDNPDGRPIWYLAFEENENRLVGTISVMPRVMCVHGESVCAGIVGDFMVSSSYRVFGPALTMQRTVVSSYKSNNIDFIYTLPNKSAQKLGEKAGFQKASDLNYYIKPISASYYLTKYVNNTLANLMTPVVSLLLKLVAKETYIISKGHFQEIKDVDGSFNKFWEMIKQRKKGLVGNHSIEYLKWRYLNNPELIFRIITYREKPENRMLGYIVFTVNDNSLEIYDLVAIQKKHEDRLMKKVVSIAREDGNRSISIRISARNDYYRRVKYFGFFKTKSDVCVLTHGMKDALISDWAYVEGNRNI